MSALDWPRVRLAEYASGSTEPWAVSVLCALARLGRPAKILELGTFEAKTTAKLAEIAAVTTVDVEKRWSSLPHGAVFCESDAIHFLQSTGAIYDFVFVDDDHEAGHVRTEVELLLGGIVRGGGLIVLHDVIGPFGLDRIVYDHDGFIIELPLLHVAGGLGVIGA